MYFRLVHLARAHRIWLHVHFGYCLSGRFELLSGVDCVAKHIPIRRRWGHYIQGLAPFGGVVDWEGSRVRISGGWVGRRLLDG